MPFRTVLLVLAALCVPSLAGAQSLEDYDYENLELRGVGVELGGIRPANVESTWTAGVRADLGYLGPNVRLVPGISFWSSRLNEGEVLELRQNVLRLCREPESDCLREFGEVRVSDLVLDLNAHYTWEAQYEVFPYAGAGASLHLLNGSGELIDDTFMEDLLDAVTPGVNLLAGVEAELGPSLRFFVEGRATLATDVRYLGATAGGSWYLRGRRAP